MTRLYAIALAISLLGCARNAVLELELDLPAQPTGEDPLFAVVQARSDEPFSEEWVDDQTIPAIALASSCARPVDPPSCDERMLDPTCSSIVSIVGDDDEILAPLNVRVRFCRSATCEAAEDASAPEHRVAIERAFYVGRFTQARVCVDAVPASTSLESIERCDVRCRDGLAAMHCRLDGTHFCE